MSMKMEDDIKRWTASSASPRHTPLEGPELTLVLLAHVLGLARKAFSMPRLPSSTHCSTSEGDGSYWRLASATVVLPE